MTQPLTSADISDFDAAVRRIVTAMVNPPVVPPVVVPPAVVATAVTAKAGDNSITLNWGAPTGAVASWIVTRSDPVWKQSLATASRSFLFTNFGAGKTYTVSIQAVLADGTVGPVVSVTVVMPSGPVVIPPVPDGSGTSGAAPMPFPARAVSLYYMMWSNSGSPKLSSIPAGVNVVNLSFVQGDPPSLVGWSSQGEASLIADAKALRARGVRIVASVGGAGGHINLGNRDAFVNGIMALSAKIPLDGLDFDLEGASLGQDNALYVAAQLKAKRGRDFAITMAPNGSNIGEYLPVAVALQKAGNLTCIGQQFYDAVVSGSAALGRVNGAVAAGIPASKYLVGTMVGDADTYWTVDECLSNYKLIKASHPTIGGAYLWEAGRAGTADWANRMGAVIKA